MDTIRRRPREVSLTDKYDTPYNFRVQKALIERMKVEAKKRGIAVSDLIRLAVEKEMKGR